MVVHGRIEKAFVRWGNWMVRGRWPVIAVVLVVTALLGSFLPQLRIDNSDEAFLRADDVERVRYDAFLKKFGPDDRVIVMVHPPDVFDLGFLEKLRAFHQSIEREVPYVEEVTSLVNARNTRGEADRLIVEDLLAEWPRTRADLVGLRERVVSNPLYLNILVSENTEYTTVTLKPYVYSTLGPTGNELGGFDDETTGEDDEPVLLTEPESRELVLTLREIVARFEGPDFELTIVGGASFDLALTETMQRDFTVFMGLAIGFILILLILLFRRASGVLLPVVVVTLALISSQGMMVLLDIPFSITLNLLPAFLVVVGLCDSIHILVIVYQQLANGVERRESIAFALGHSGLAVVMTSVTTAIGLSSFTLAEIAPIRQLGVVGPIGVMMAMLYSLTLLPAMLAVSPLRRRADRAGARVRALVNAILARVGSLATSHPVRVLGATALILLVSGFGFAELRFAHDGRAWFPPDDPLNLAMDLIDREMKGASTLEAVIHTGRENGLHEPDTLNRIERAMRFSETLDIAGIPVSKAVSIVDVVKETHRALNENRPEFYVLPQQRSLIAQELLLFENSGTDDLEELTDSQFETARLSVRTPWAEGLDYLHFIAEVETGFREILGPEIDFELTGGPKLFSQIFANVIVSLSRSYVFALLVITPLMVLLIGNLRRGLLAMIPNLIPVYLVLCLMGALDIPLDASTLLIGAIIIGLAVDDTIHFMHKFNRYYEDCGDARQAVRETLTTTGAALLFTSLVLTLGFSVFLGAYMRNGVWFGLLACSGTIVAFAADILVAPALMALATRRATGPPVAEASTAGWWQRS